MHFELVSTDGAARHGRLSLPRGEIQTPCFMPVGTYGTVKSMTPEELHGLGARIVVVNTLHLMLRPGEERVAALGGLYRFMNWRWPILTDSGGFQVFSLAESRKLTEEGVWFRSPLDGSRVFLGPEESMAVQRSLGSDIVMVFDECTQYPATEEQARESMEMSLRWAGRSKVAHEGNPAAQFGIVQGGIYPDLRETSLDGLMRLGFDGYAIGGLAVGEPGEERIAVLDALLPRMPLAAPRYLMGVGLPEDLVEAVRRGVDMFDCVLPTRNARNGHLFCVGRNHQNQEWRDSRPTNGRWMSHAIVIPAGTTRGPISTTSTSVVRSRARLNTTHNLHFYLSLMTALKESVRAGNLDTFVRSFYASRGLPTPISAMG